jgi:hypothetical protein
MNVRILNCSTNKENYNLCLSDKLAGFVNNGPQTGDMVYLVVKIDGVSVCGARFILDKPSNHKPWPDSYKYVNVHKIYKIERCKPFDISILRNTGNKHWVLKYVQGAKPIIDKKAIGLLNSEFMKNKIAISTQVKIKFPEKVLAKDLKNLFISIFKNEKSFKCDEGNPFLIKFKGKEYYVFLKNISSAYYPKYPDNARIQLPYSDHFKKISNSKLDFIILGYNSEFETFSAWDPVLIKDRLNVKGNVSLFTRFSFQKTCKINEFNENHISDGTKIVLFSVKSTPKYFNSYKSLFSKKIISIKERDSDENSSYQTPKRKLSLNTFEINKEYKKSDIYSIMKVPASQQRGKWDKGYCFHDGRHYIFANVGISGYGYEGNSSNTYNYNNILTKDGYLEWEAANKSKKSWPSINKILNDAPLIFIRDINTTEDYWKFVGQGKLIESKEFKFKPVYVKWKIENVIGKSAHSTSSINTSNIKVDKVLNFNNLESINDKNILKNLNNFKKSSDIMNAVLYLHNHYSLTYPKMTINKWIKLVKKYFGI